MALESAIQRTAIRKAEDAGAWVIREHQDGRRRKGIPDVVMCYLGVFVAVEFKQLDGRVRPEQIIELSKIRKAGGIGIIARDWEDVASMFACIDRWQRGQGELWQPELPVPKTIKLDDIDVWGSV